MRGVVYGLVFVVPFWLLLIWVALHAPWMAVVFYGGAVVLAVAYVLVSTYEPVE